ncbi:MAG: hypothetical protein IID33_05485 [Planctomycetes bacterium]|nr:hypothetical protein [Planctomycetota bacterium]
MRKRQWKTWLIMISSGSVMFQAPGCAESALVATSFFSAITAGSVFVLVSRILND